tara:strand:- start:834 stop:1022 length:189 start_codon:yes stop_codon:yes gene_type:complete
MESVTVKKSEVTKQQRLEMLQQSVEAIDAEIKRLKKLRFEHEKEGNEIRIELFGLSCRKSPV